MLQPNGIRFHCHVMTHLIERLLDRTVEKSFIFIIIKKIAPKHNYLGVIEFILYKTIL
jgi:hypothetical protein